DGREVGLVVLRGSVDRKVKERAVGIEQQGRRESVGPAENQIHIVLAVLGISALETAGAIGRTGAVKCAQQREAKLVVLTELVVEPEGEAGRVRGIGHKLKRV